VTAPLQVPTRGGLKVADDPLPTEHRGKNEQSRQVVETRVGGQPNRLRASADCDDLAEIRGIGPSEQRKTRQVMLDPPPSGYTRLERWRKSISGRGEMAMQSRMWDVTRFSPPRLVQWARLEERLGHARVVSPEAAEAVVHQCKRRHLLLSLRGLVRAASHRFRRVNHGRTSARRPPQNENATASLVDAEERRLLGIPRWSGEWQKPRCGATAIVRPPARHRPRCPRARQMSGLPGSHAAGSRGVHQPRVRHSWRCCPHPCRSAGERARLLPRCRGARDAPARLPWALQMRRSPLSCVNAA
jgi:hypothetical protein